MVRNSKKARRVISNACRKGLADLEGDPPAERFRSLIAILLALFEWKRERPIANKFDSGRKVGIEDQRRTWSVLRYDCRQPQRVAPECEALEGVSRLLSDQNIVMPHP